MREPIWIALLLIQPMFWLLLYGQLFQRIADLPGFGTNSYIDFLAPAVVIMNAFFGGTWSGMAMITDLDRDVRRALPRDARAPRRARVLAGRPLRADGADPGARSSCSSSLAARRRRHGGPLGWIVIVLAGDADRRWASPASRRGSRC